MTSKKIATALDNAARKIYNAGTRVGGETGGKVADAISNIVIIPVRSLSSEPCTCGTDCEH